MKRFNHFVRFFEAYNYYVYINRLEGIHMCFICLKRKYSDQIRVMLTVLFIQSKSAFASFTVLEPPLIFNLAQSDHVTNLKRVGTGMGEYLYDKESLKNSSKCDTFKL